MDIVYLTQDEFDSIETNKPGIIAKEGLVIKKQSGSDWFLITYGEYDEETKTYNINFKKIIIK